MHTLRAACEKPSRRTLVVTVTLLLACGGDTTSPDPQPAPERVPATIGLSVRQIEFASLEDTISLGVTVRDQNGEPMSAAVSWSSTSATVVSVSAQGTVVSRGNGVARIVARAGNVADTALVTVEQVVASVAVMVPDAETLVGGSATAVAIARDARGVAIAGHEFTWSVGDTGIAAIDGNGTYRGKREGTTTVIATGSGGTSASAPIQVVVLEFADVTAGAQHTCAITTSGRAYCWGPAPLLGIGVLAGSYPAPVRVQGEGYTRVASGGHSCAIRGGAVFCWGDNHVGQLGTGAATGPAMCGSAPCHLTPVPAQSSASFVQVAIGFNATCGLTAEGAAYCWGNHRFAQIGTGSPGGQSCSYLGDPWPCRPAPVPVTGGHVFTHLKFASETACGLTTDQQVFCWGAMAGGKLGDGGSTVVEECQWSSESIGACSSTPLLAASGAAFATIGGGSAFVCAIRMAGGAECWGSNTRGQLGTGSLDSDASCPACFATPQPVLGGDAFTTITAGYGSHACALTATGEAYCWGSDSFGQLGSGDATPPCGTSVCSADPVQVAGGLRFRALGAGTNHTCGITTEGALYCWGDNRLGALGDGTLENRAVPVKVVGSR